MKRKPENLSELRRALDGLIRQCGHGTVSECRILEALAPCEMRITIAGQIVASMLMIVS